MTQKSLLELYQLLWEEIKDETMTMSGLCREIRILVRKNIFSDVDKDLLITDIYSQFPDVLRWKHVFPLTPEGTEQRKAFVLRRIEELKTENQ